MQIVIDATTVAAVLGAIGGALTTAGASYTFVIRPLRGLVTKLREMFEDWSGEPDRPGVPGRDGVMVRLSRQEAEQQTIKAQLAAIQAEIRPNGGGSMRDEIRRIGAMVVTLRDQAEQAENGARAER